MSVLIQDARYVVRDAARIERDADVWIEGRHIRAVGQNLAPLAGRGDDLTIVDARGQAVIPGLINAHTHLYQCLLRGLRDDLPLEGWLQAVVYPFLQESRAAYPDDEVMRAAARVGCAEMLQNGTTSFIDMEGWCEASWAAWQEVGIRGVSAIVFSNEDVPDEMRLPLAAVQSRVVEGLARGLAAARGSATLSFMLAPATPMMCSRPLLEWAADLAQQYDVPIHTHACETMGEVARSRQATGLSPIQLLDATGLLTSRSTLAHCVHLGPEDLELIADRGAMPVHCPKSNMKLGSGTAPVPTMLAAGLKVALANDGPASNDLLDMFEEMRTAALLHKVQGGAGALSARSVFRMATEYGAAACGIEAGTIDPGRLADLALIDLDQPHLAPDHDIVPLLVYCGKGSDVCTVIVDGRVVMRHRHLVLADEEQILCEAREIGLRRFAQISRKQAAGQQA